MSILGRSRTEVWVSISNSRSDSTLSPTNSSRTGRGEFGFGQKLRSWKPIQDCFVKRILRTHARANNPHRFRHPPRNNGGQKSLSRRDDVGKFYRRPLGLDLFELARNRSILRGALE